MKKLIAIVLTVMLLAMGLGVALPVAAQNGPEITLTKIGPPEEEPWIGYFQSLDADYTYYVENTGDYPLDNVDVVDDSTSTPSPTMVDGFNVGDLGEPPNGLLDPGEIWVYTSEWLLECTGYHMMEFTNTATVEADVFEDTETVSATACWTVIIFQWQPRTIGYWGNWDNHYETAAFTALFEDVLDQSNNLPEGFGPWAPDDYSAVHDFLLGKPPFKQKDEGETAVQQFHMEKQFLAAWLNVKAYMDWVDPNYIEGFTGSADAAMDPDATVYLTADCMPDGAAGLFETDALSVWDLIWYIEENKVDDGWDAEDFGIAYEVLDIMNNAEDNGYCAFIDPDWEPDECPSEEIERWPEEGTAYVGYEDWINGDFDYNDFGMTFFVEEIYVAGDLTEITMTFTAVVFDSGMWHLIHIETPLTGTYSYSVARSVPAYPGVLTLWDGSTGQEKPAGSYSGSGDLDVVLFNTAQYTWPQKKIGQTVTVHVVLDTPYPRPTPALPPRDYNVGGGDFYDLPPLMANYDPWEIGTLFPFPNGSLFHIEDTQVITSTANQKIYTGNSPYGTIIPIGTEAPMILVVPKTDWIPPFEDTTITGPYNLFDDFYTTGSPANWYLTIQNSTTQKGGLSWSP